MPAALPKLDAHTTTIDADPEVVWSALVTSVDSAFTRAGASLFARVVGCTDTTASGPRPLAEGATIPGFRVAAAAPTRHLVLEGRHRFSSYTLTFDVEPRGGGQTWVQAQSHARFPGLHGRAYRLLVVGTGAHVAAVRRLLSTVRRRAEGVGSA